MDSEEKGLVNKVKLNSIIFAAINETKIFSTKEELCRYYNINQEKKKEVDCASFISESTSVNIP